MDSTSTTTRRGRQRQQKRTSHTSISPPSSVNNKVPTPNEKRRSTWTGSTERKSSTTLGGQVDPFAGMKTCINYQEEIERLKTIVPTVEAKKRSSYKPTTLTDHFLTTTNDTPVMTLSTKPFTTVHMTSSSSSSSSPSPSSPIESSSSPVSSPSLSSTLSSSDCSPPSITTETSYNDYGNDTDCNIHEKESMGSDLPASTTDEKSTRFLEFIKSWTGGWNGWANERNQGYISTRQQQQQQQYLSSRLESYPPRPSIDPWHHHQSLPDQFDQSRYTPTSHPHSYYTSSLHHHHQEYTHHPLHQPLQQNWISSSHHHHTSSIGIIGDRHPSATNHHLGHGHKSTSRFGHSGVFVM